MLDSNMRLNCILSEQCQFLNLLTSLHKGNCSKEEWRLLLTRQPSHVSNLSDFKFATRLFFKSSDVSDFNLNWLKDLNQPIIQDISRYLIQNFLHPSAINLNQ